jgi:hypothetical protein
MPSRTATRKTRGQSGTDKARGDRAVTEQDIRERAYRIYLAREKEGVPGDPVSDWLRAQQELQSRTA